LTLSSGALALSIGFLDKVVDLDRAFDTSLLVASWALWGLSLAAVLMSHYFSALALRKTIEQVDTGQIYQGPPGGKLDTAIKVLNAAGGLAFLGGLATMLAFALANVSLRS